MKIWFTTVTGAQLRWHSKSLVFRNRQISSQRTPVGITETIGLQWHQPNGKHQTLPVLYDCPVLMKETKHWVLSHTFGVYLWANAIGLAVRDIEMSRFTVTRDGIEWMTLFVITVLNQFTDPSNSAILTLVLAGNSL